MSELNIEYPLFDKHKLCPSARYVGGTSRYLCECEKPNECLGAFAAQQEKEQANEK